MRLPQALLILAALPLAACSSDAGSDYASVYTMAKNYWEGTPPISLEQAAAVPYASIGVKVGDSPQAMLVLGTASGDDTLWIAGRSVAIETRNGRIVRTAGLAHNLTSLAVASGTQFPSLAPQPAAEPFNWLADYADQNRFAVRIACTPASPAEDPIVLLGKTIATVRIDEHCEAPTLDWTFVNQFWVDPNTGFVWQSVQHVAPNLDPVEIEVLRPPAE